MTKSVDNVAVALLLERARRIAEKKRKKKKEKKKREKKIRHNKTLGKLLPT